MSALLSILFLLPVCPAGNLAAGKPVQAVHASGEPALVTDGVRAIEGTPRKSSLALALQGGDASVTVDLQESRSLVALVLQADDDDAYSIEGSEDGVSFHEIWRFTERDFRSALHTVHVPLPTPVSARYLRVVPSGGDGQFAVSELEAYCQRPNPWPPKLEYEKVPFNWRQLSDRTSTLIKGWLAAAATLLLLVGWLLARAGRENRGRRIRDVLLGVLAALSFLAWWNFGSFHAPGYLHLWDEYHYFLGSKYFAELGHTRLYECSVVVDLEDGLDEDVRHRHIRNLDDNSLETTAAVMADPGRCKQHFSAERWQEFRRDAVAFRDAMGMRRWSYVQSDHGYNPSPVWTLFGGTISNFFTVTPRTLVLMALIDPLLLLVMWGFVFWAFDWRAACVALIYWGTAFPSRYLWVGGAFIRQDWLAALVIGICLLKKRRHLGGGLLVAWSALVRVFPVMALIGVALPSALRCIREKRLQLAAEERRIVMGAAIALLVLVPASTLRLHGVKPWIDFVHNSRKLVGTPFANSMGLPMALSHGRGTRAIYQRDFSQADPFEKWKRARTDLFHARLWVYVLAIGCFLVLLSRALAQEEAWVAAVLGLGLALMVADLACYYTAFFLCYGLLAERRRWVGPLVTLAATLTCFLPLRLPWDDDTYSALSYVLVLTTFIVTAGWRNRLESSS